MIRKLFFVFLILSSNKAFAQNHQEVEIKQTIDLFFDGMREADSLKIKSTISELCSLKSVFINSSDGKTQIIEEEMARFIKSVTQKREGIIYDKKLLSYDIKIDGRMAIAWTPYRFYVNKRFVHCGVNVFSLAQLNGSWKIISILDTRKKEGCEVTTE